MKLEKIHYDCMELLCEDETITAISETLKVSRTSIYKWLKDDSFKAELAKCEQATRDRVEHTFVARLPQAVDRLWKLSEQEDDKRTSLAATKEWLERALGRVSTTISVDGVESNEYDLSDAMTRLTVFDNPRSGIKPGQSTAQIA